MTQHEVSSLTEYRNERSHELRKPLHRRIGERVLNDIKDIRRHPGEVVVAIGLAGAAFLLAGAGGRAPVHESKSPEDPFDEKIQTAIDAGPQDPSYIIGTYTVGDSNVTVRMTNMTEQVGGNEDDPTQLRATTVSANEFAQTAYGPKDQFTLFYKDLNNDGKREVLGQRVK